MADMDVLIICRNTLFEMRRIEMDREQLRDCVEETPEAAEELNRRIAAQGNALKCLKKRYPAEMAEAMVVLDKLPRKQRKVMMFYYIAGLPMTEVAKKLNYGLRTVQRIKQDATANLDMNTTKRRKAK